jgi:hypothetical protein
MGRLMAEIRAILRWSEHHAIFFGGLAGAAMGSLFGVPWWQSLLIGAPLVFTTGIQDDAHQRGGSSSDD